MNESKLAPWKVLVVDDVAEVHQRTQVALEEFRYADREVHLLSAYSMVEAQTLFNTHPDLAVVFLGLTKASYTLDVGLLHYIRTELANDRARIILRVGPDEIPEEALLRLYDITDYQAKDEWIRPRLVMTLLSALRTYQTICTAQTCEEAMITLQRQVDAHSVELQKALDSADEAKYAKDEFLSVMNHELRTPLNVILMRAEIMQSGIYGVLTAKQNNSLDLIMRSGHQLLAIIDDILDLVSIENGRIKPIIRRVSLGAIREQSLQLVEELAQKKAIQIKASDIDPAIHIRSDERRLVQIIEKLLKNAVKFSAEGTQIGVSIEPDTSASTIRIVVWDEGIGIAQEDVQRLFQPFVQLEHSLTRRYEGAGIGLTIAARLIDLLGGTIAVESTIGAGSRFLVTIPVTIEP